MFCDFWGLIPYLDMMLIGWPIHNISNFLWTPDSSCLLASRMLIYLPGLVAYIPSSYDPWDTSFRLIDHWPCHDLLNYLASDFSLSLTNDHSSNWPWKLNLLILQLGAQLLSKIQMLLNSIVSHSSMFIIPI